ncbi:uncharacterized protein LOC113464492 isoform X2 [Ceratina calcarata]|uniref:Uncharacterized protein LOC113464492 isoform X2 n=1 Tax=Ceratina calcarata TaxID=156304 RepID=A0AAJ7WCE8_9HYME|nr:uncharacterized protein LOC113464492 isoform X2 [Ceratina calcarata]
MEPKGSILDWFRPMKKKSGRGVADRAGGGVLDSCIRQVIRPLRIFQFLAVVLIFVLITYTIHIVSHDVTSVICILILALSGVYVFVLALDLICQFGGGEIHSLPMFIFSLLGMIFFAAAGIIILFTYTSPWTIVAIACFSLVAFILFVIDVTLVLAFWKRSCNLCQQCCYANKAEVLYQATGECDPQCTETVKYDLMTSVSSVQVPSGDEQPTPDHSKRKVNYGHRREYVDCKTSARTLATTSVCDVQTEKRPVVNIQSQTPREVKEIPVQTVSRCEMCNRKINLSSKSSGTIPASHQACAPCPALVQLFRGHPCSPGCRCNLTGIIMQQNQQAQTQQQREAKLNSDPNHRTEPADKNLHDTLPSEKDKLDQASRTIKK